MHFTGIQVPILTGFYVRKLYSSPIIFYSQRMCFKMQIITYVAFQPEWQKSPVAFDVKVTLSCKINFVLLVTGKWEPGHLSENDWCRNAKQRGFEIKYLNWLVLLHYLSLNINLPSMSLLNQIRIYQLWIYQNKLKLNLNYDIWLRL